jgi:hypothetical protein
LTAVVVDPTPPFWFAIAMILIPGSARASRAGDRALAIADFSESDFGGAPKPTREGACAPRISQKRRSS